MTNFTTSLRWTCGVFFTALICFPGMAALAQTPPVKVDIPDIKVGDSWTFDKLDGWEKTRDHTRVTVVTSVDEKEIRIESKIRESGVITNIVRTRELNELFRESGSEKNIATPCSPLFSFPLEAGKTWSKEVIYTRNTETHRKVVATLKGKVIGWEKVTVPAGTFDALKIEVGGYYNGSNTNGSWSGQVFHNIWYVPEVKNFVRWEFRDTTSSVPTYNNEIFELTGYKLAPQVSKTFLVSSKHYLQGHPTNQQGNKP